MAIAYFPSLDSADTIEVIFIARTGGDARLRLLVDSGFTGVSSFVLPESAAHLAHARAASTNVAGALRGTQKRVAVSYMIAALSIQAMATAILSDTGGLALPPGVEGLVGLAFLRRFRRWGAEKSDDGSWRFFLETHGS
jgi:predicted aspartyl protease